MKYKVVYSEHSYVELVSTVNGFLELGWKPQGGVSGNYMNGFLQALVKEEEDD